MMYRFVSSIPSMIEGEGRVFANHDDLKREAVRQAGLTLRGNAEEVSRDGAWTLEVRDDTGLEVLRVSLVIDG
jgi:hypothetical protein